MVNTRYGRIALLVLFTPLVFVGEATEEPVVTTEVAKQSTYIYFCPLMAIL